MKFLLTLLLNVIGIAFLASVVIIPIMPQFKNDNRVDSLLGTVLCNPGERLVREQSSNTILRQINLTMTPYCVSQQQKRDVTTRWLTIGLGGFAVTFLMGTVLEIVLILNAVRRGISGAVMPKGQPVTMPMPPVQSNLSEKLRQLEEAHKAGLVTYDEYDRMRQDILKKI